MYGGSKVKEWVKELMWWAELWSEEQRWREEEDAEKKMRLYIRARVLGVKNFDWIIRELDLVFD